MTALLVLVMAFGTASAAPTAQEGGDAAPPVQVPFLEEWMSSGHADATAEAFIHWDEESPAEVPESCAKCHSSTGYLDFLGADGTEAGVVNAPHPVGTVVDCVACHNDVTVTKTSVVMPSGLELTGLGDESRCMECHQGRQSKVSVDAAIAKAGVDADTVSDQLSFLNIHYYAAAATKYGTLAKGGYEYDGNSYDANFAHVDGYDTCNGCHNPHTLELKLEECATCHASEEMPIESADDLKDIRMQGSGVDYDGDEDTDEGIYFEIEGLQEALLGAIQAYANEVVGTAVAYTPDAHPYWYIDANGDGELTEDEINADGRFVTWTPRMLQAAYNYQVSKKDPGNYAHGGKYTIQLLYDSIASLNEQIGEPVDMTAMRRIDAGHFAGSEEAFRHWDAEGVVPGSCTKCHTAGGLPELLAEGVNTSAPPSNGFQCATCHNDLAEYTIYEFANVKFPSGAVIDSGNMDTNLCMNCHMGRESTVSVDRVIGDAEPDDQAEGLRFLNPHYFASAATRYGTEAKGAYEYADKEYLGFFDHADGDAAQCRDCHSTHRLEVKADDCTDCHEEVDGPETLKDIRYTLTDFDGNGDDEEGLYYEIENMSTQLFAAIQAYAAETVGTPIAYDSHAYPYFFIDGNANGEVDPEEAVRENGFAAWTPRLLRAAYNYQWASKDPGSFAHNGQYIIQTLYDSLEDLGADVSAMTRP
jgi:hypothetical protein